MNSLKKLHVVVVGSGAAGLSASWLLSKRHQITLLEKAPRLGGHANTELTGDEQAPQIDTGFIVYNEPCYPNLTRWFADMDVATENSNMSFSVSRDNGNFEYAGGPPLGLVAQPSLLLSPRFHKMLRDLVRFYREAPSNVPDSPHVTLGEFLTAGGYSDEFLNDHLLPFAAAIWSSSANTMLDYPAAAFIRFCENHGLLKLRNRPQWRTVTGGSRNYVDRVAKIIGQQNSQDTRRHSIKTDFAVDSIERAQDYVIIRSESGEQVRADHVVIAAHADQALKMLGQPTDSESKALGAFSYEPNQAILHTDSSFMPRRKRAWCSWNYVEEKAVDNKVCVSYWMNRLQNLQSDKNYFVTLNPSSMPAANTRVCESEYHHPVFNHTAIRAQQQLWDLQGQQRTWFCGSYFGSGFHEDAIQSGLAVAEQLGDVVRPWELANPSDRIAVTHRAYERSGSLEYS